ncbi:hypothetical protein CRG98_022287 [Punica granatum]|uniref:Uncharacterized protein n=1 Tax=Punica granatum TaxID=22663 RepID=A0A2I0JM19_PUNGR|nr:hypothetical protein CRG98_022287 [Punica granatum]
MKDRNLEKGEKGIATPKVRLTTSPYSGHKLWSGGGTVLQQEEEDAAADEDISAQVAPIVELEKVAVTPAKKTNLDPILDLQISSLTPLPTHPRSSETRERGERDERKREIRYCFGHVKKELTYSEPSWRRWRDVPSRNICKTF